MKRSLFTTVLIVFLFLGFGFVPNPSDGAGFGKIINKVMKKTAQKQSKKSLMDRRVLQKESNSDTLMMGTAAAAPHGLKKIFQCNNSDRYARSSANVNVRGSGSLNGTKLGTLKKGTRFCVRRRNGDYFATQYGWVSGRYLIAE